MSEPEITQEDRDVQGHTNVLKRDQPRNDAAPGDAAQRPEDDDTAGHTINLKR